MAFVEDLNGFFADFGASASVGVGAPLPVLFDEAYASPLGMGSVQPSALVPAAAFIAAGGADGVQIRIDATAAPGGQLGDSTQTYTVRSSEPESGLLRLMLERVL